MQNYDPPEDGSPVSSGKIEASRDLVESWPVEINWQDRHIAANRPRPITNCYRQLHIGIGRV